MSGALFKVNLINDSVSSVDVINGGSGYKKTPKIYIDSPFQNGTTAKAYCNVVNESIQSIIVTDGGSGYTQTPNIIDDYNMDSNSFNQIKYFYELSIKSNQSSTIEFSYYGIIILYDDYDNYMHGTCSLNSNPKLFTYNEDILCYGYKNGDLNGLLIHNLSNIDKNFKIIIFQ